MLVRGPWVTSRIFVHPFRNYKRVHAMYLPPHWYGEKVNVWLSGFMLGASLGCLVWLVFMMAFLGAEGTGY